MNILGFNKLIKIYFKDSEKDSRDFYTLKKDTIGYYCAFSYSSVKKPRDLTLEENCPVVVFDASIFEIDKKVYIVDKNTLRDDIVRFKPFVDKWSNELFFMTYMDESEVGITTIYPIFNKQNGNGLKESDKKIEQAKQDFRELFKESYFEFYHSNKSGFHSFSGTNCMSIDV